MKKIEEKTVRLSLVNVWARESERTSESMTVRTDKRVTEWTMCEWEILREGSNEKSNEGRKGVEETAKPTELTILPWNNEKEKHSEESLNVKRYRKWK